MVQLGAVECAMALGFEKMNPGSLGTVFEDRVPPMERTVSMTAELGGFGNGPFGESFSAPG